MRVIRIHVESLLAAGTRVELSGKAALHVTRVLRLGAGDPITLFNGDGLDYPSIIKELHKGSVTIAVGLAEQARAESPLAVTLVQGIARGERMDLVVQKATELGVASIVPVATARSVVRLDADTRAKKLAHWRGVAIAACEQCGRATVPAIAEPGDFDAWLATPPPPGTLRVLLSPEAKASLVATVRGAQRIEMLVGPEGGLEDAERELALGVGYLACRLGPRVLRSETAAVAALAVLQATEGDLS